MGELEALRRMEGEQLDFGIAQLRVIAIIKHEAPEHVLGGIPLLCAPIHRREEELDILPARQGPAAIVLS